MKSTIYTQTVLDQETGELIPTRWIKKEVLTKEAFVRAYIKDLGILAKCSGAEQSTILCSLKYVEYNTNVLYINSLRRQEIAQCAGMTINTVNSAISRLVKKNILLKKASGTYLLNPQLFFFGTDLEREKVFCLSVKYVILD